MGAASRQEFLVPHVACMAPVLLNSTKTCCKALSVCTLTCMCKQAVQPPAKQLAVLHLEDHAHARLKHCLMSFAPGGVHLSMSLLSILKIPLGISTWDCLRRCAPTRPAIMCPTGFQFCHQCPPSKSVHFFSFLFFFFRNNEPHKNQFAPEWTCVCQVRWSDSFIMSHMECEK